jgi:hypothetical protein
MGKGLALTVPVKLASCLIAIAVLSACGNDKGEPSPMAGILGGVAKSTLAKVKGKRGSATAPVAAAPVTRADIEKYGIPILRAVIKSRGADALVTISDTKGAFVTWATTDGTTFTLRNGVLSQTRGLGPDLMSAAVPSVAELSKNGGTHRRSIFLLGEDDRSTRRDYDCTVSVVGNETIEVFSRGHATLHIKEECIRPQGKFTNDFWLEGAAVRKSRQWTSPGIGYIEFEKVVD